MNVAAWPPLRSFWAYVACLMGLTAGGRHSSIWVIHRHRVSLLPFFLPSFLKDCMRTGNKRSSPLARSKSALQHFHSHSPSIVWRKMSLFFCLSSRFTGALRLRAHTSLLIDRRSPRSSFKRLPTEDVTFLN